jgi:ABC-type antimicrobial peptide transport system permease subunit
VWMVLRDSLMLTAVGVAIGIPFAVLTGRALASSLYGVKPNDAVTLVLAVLGIALVALGASMIPARRAASIDPLTALRSE